MKRCAVVALMVILALCLAACGGGATKPTTGPLAEEAKPPAIGEPYGGGVVAYILQDGDPGYVAGQTHGLVATTADQSAGIQWSTQPYWFHSRVPGGTDTALGTGAANTDAIIAQNGGGTTYAAGLARACTDGDYSDWYLPSDHELHKLYLNRAAIGGFEPDASYWSSSEFRDGALDYTFSDGWQYNTYFKRDTARVRAVRSF